MPWSGNISRQVSLSNFIYEIDLKPCNNVCYFQRRQRGDKPPTEEEIQTALVNKPPGAPPLTILSFTRSFHGRTIGLFSFYCFVVFVILSFYACIMPEWPAEALCSQCICSSFFLSTLFSVRDIPYQTCEHNIL